MKKVVDVKLFKRKLSLYDYFIDRRKVLKQSSSTDKTKPLIEYYEQEIHQIETFLSFLDDKTKELFIDKFLKGYSISKLESKYMVSSSNIYYLIDKMVEKHIQKLYN